MVDERFVARLFEARSARLATVSSEGHPHIVPIVFATVGDLIVTTVDHKAKTTKNLKRLRNIVHNPHVSVIADHYDEDWEKLWWLRVDGTARVLEAGSAFDSALDALTEKYEQYRDRRPDGPVIEIAIERLVGWQAKRPE